MNIHSLDNFFFFACFGMSWLSGAEKDIFLKALRKSAGYAFICNELEALITEAQFKLVMEEICRDPNPDNDMSWITKASEFLPDMDQYMNEYEYGLKRELIGEYLRKLKKVKNLSPDFPFEKVNAHFWREDWEAAVKILEKHTIYENLNDLFGLLNKVSGSAFSFSNLPQTAETEKDNEDTERGKQIAELLVSLNNLKSLKEEALNKESGLQKQPEKTNKRAAAQKKSTSEKALSQQYNLNAAITKYKMELNYALSGNVLCTEISFINWYKTHPDAPPFSYAVDTVNSLYVERIAHNLSCFLLGKEICTGKVYYRLLPVTEFKNKPANPKDTEYDFGYLANSLESSILCIENTDLLSALSNTEFGALLSFLKNNKRHSFIFFRRL